MMDIETITITKNERDNLLRAFETTKDINIYLKKKVDELQEELRMLKELEKNHYDNYYCKLKQ